MRKLLIVLMAMHSIAFAEEIYVSQLGSGTTSGKDSDNTRSMEWFKSRLNWRQDEGFDGKIGAGDIVYFIGNITEPVVILKDGMEGQPIVFKLPANANVVKGSNLHIEFK